MSADVLYHGTRAGFRGPGGLVLPGSEVGKNNWPDLNRNDAVYVTTDRELALAFAEHSSGRGRPKVLEVAPMGPLEADDSTVWGDEHESFRCPAGRVLRVTR